MRVPSEYGRVIGLRQTVLAKSQNYTFDGVFRYKSSSMLIHLIGWALVYGWMTRLILSDFCDFPQLECHPVDYSKLSTE